MIESEKKIMKNTAANTIFRHCIDESKGDCPYMIKNQYNVETCSIDGIVQVKFYGCRPQAILNRYPR